MDIANIKLGVFGAGVMGGAIVRGLLTSETLRPDQVWATSRTDLSCQKIAGALGIRASRQFAAELADTDVLLLCVKPKGAERVLEQLHQNGLPPSTLVISILAGISLEALESGLGQPNPVVRAMTNTPCIVGKGMTALAGGKHANAAHLAMAWKIFESVGLCLELDESMFDAVTGLGGSGPAYFYLIMEALADGGVRVGLPRDVALKIVTQTVLGAATMVERSGRHPAALRDDVTTPAGCTIGGLLIMEDGKIRSVLARAVEEATTIAGKLGNRAKK
jgi:pyrroline-5-carboxylate reductase